MRLFGPGEVIDRREVLLGSPWLVLPMRVVQDTGDPAWPVPEPGASLARLAQSEPRREPR